MDNLSGGVEDGEEVIISVRPEEFDMEPGTKGDPRCDPFFRFPRTYHPLLHHH